MITATNIWQRPRYTPMPLCVPATAFVQDEGGTNWFPPLLITAEQVAGRLLGGSYVAQARELLTRLEPDSYSRYVQKFLAAGQARFGSDWQYADIVTVLLCLSDMLRPRTYLEVGVRRGRSLCAVASVVPDCSLLGFDIWEAGYAGMPNPGPAFVHSELDCVGHRGPRELVSGDSHVTLPQRLGGPDAPLLDLATVDGDHSPEGAWRDLCDVLPRLAVGGAIVFDDIAHPDLPGLREVWNALVVSDPRYSSWSFDGLGYGVAFALRRY